MINKIHFGKRVASGRKNMSLSQAELAERLGVTAQAVSKWECGTALPDVDLLLGLSKLYHLTINEMLEDTDIVKKLANRPYTSPDIACFVPENESPDNKGWADEIVSGKWIARNWHNCKSDEISDLIAAKANGHGGLILEIGAGPGGGFMPCILKRNPDAAVIISDISPTVVREWKRFLDKEMDSPNIGYAAFNFCNMPFPDNSIDVISDGGGIGNTEGGTGTKEKAIKEAYRVLKTDGLFITSTGFITKEMLSSLPEAAQKEIIQKRPDVFEDLYEATVLAGFKKIDSIISGNWDTDHDKSAISDLARKLGVNLKFTAYVRFCEK